MALKLPTRRRPANFHQVQGLDGLYRSASPAGLTRRQRADLVAAYGLRTVVTAAPEEPVLTWPPGVTVVRLPVYKPVLTRSQWSLWKDVLEDAAASPILVHCVAGAERTGILCAHAQVHHGVTPRRAVRHMRRYGRGFWEGAGHRYDLEVVCDSLLCLKATKNVLSDAVVELVLSHKGIPPEGDPDAVLARLMGESW